MFGALRFLLASFVAISHTELITSFHLGVFAVVIFYILAGYFMAYSYFSNFKGSLKNLSNFYIDRFLRIYPLYLFVIFLTLIFTLSTNFGQPKLNLISLLSNITIIPLNLFFGQKAVNILHNPDRFLIPPAWSLGAELQFYLIIPFLLKFKSLLAFLLPISFLIFIAASFGIFFNDNYTYRFLPGILFTFLAGVIIYLHKDRLTNKFNLVLILFIWLLSLILLLFRLFYRNPEHPNVLEVATGFVLGILVVAALSKNRKHFKLDVILGNLSYPIFLVHFPSFYLVDYLSNQYKLTLTAQTRGIIQLGVTFLIGFFLYKYAETSFQAFRKKVQQKLMKQKYSS